MPRLPPWPLTSESSFDKVPFEVHPVGKWFPVSMGVRRTVERPVTPGNAVRDRRFETAQPSRPLLIL